MKRLQKVVALVMLIVVIPLASFANEITEEDTSIVRNPDRGFYKLIQVELQQGDEDFTRFEKQIISVENEYPDISIISFQLNLKNYTQKTEINKIKINDIDKYFSIMREHGYKGAADMGNYVAHCYQWDATSDVMEDWMYEDLAVKYALDSQIRQWMEEVNPWALHRIAEVLLEAEQRQMWKAKPETKKELQKLLLDIEGEMEERAD